MGLALAFSVSNTVSVNVSVSVGVRVSVNVGVSDSVSVSERGSVPAVDTSYLLFLLYLVLCFFSRGCRTDIERCQSPGQAGGTSETLMSPREVSLSTTIHEQTVHPPPLTSLLLQ